MGDTRRINKEGGRWMESSGNMEIKYLQMTVDGENIWKQMVDANG